MKNIRRVVALVDFLDNTDKIVDSALSVAKQMSAETHFVHIFNFYKDDPLLDNVFVQRCEDRLLAKAKSRMAHLLATANEADNACTGEVRSGNPQEIFTQLSASKYSDMLIICPNNL